MESMGFNHFLKKINFLEESNNDKADKIFAINKELKETKVDYLVSQKHLNVKVTAFAELKEEVIEIKKENVKF
jgi:hypothetical protein